MTIVVDIGNTSVLLGKIENNIIIDQLRIQTESIKIELDNINDDTRTELANFIDNKSNKILLSGVVPQAMLNLKLLIEEMYENI